MSISSFIGDNTLLIGVGMIMLFVIWKFILEPIMNEGKAIKPTEDDIKTFGEKIQENLNTEVDI